MGSYGFMGKLWLNYGELWEHRKELWGIMRNYGVLGAFMSRLLRMLVSFLFVFCSFPQTCKIRIFIVSTMFCMFVCHICTNPSGVPVGHLAQIEHLQARTMGMLRDPRVHKPHIDRAWGLLSAMRARLNSFSTNFGPATKSLLKKETKGRRWCTASDRKSLKAVLNAVVQK